MKMYFKAPRHLANACSERLAVLYSHDGTDVFNEDR